MLAVLLGFCLVLVLQRVFLSCLVSCFVMIVSGKRFWLRPRPMKLCPAVTCVVAFCERRESNHICIRGFSGRVAEFVLFAACLCVLLYTVYEHMCANC